MRTFLWTSCYGKDYIMGRTHRVVEKAYVVFNFFDDLLFDDIEFDIFNIINSCA